MSTPNKSQEQIDSRVLEAPSAIAAASEALGLLEALAEAIAARVVDKLRAGDLAGYVDQSASPLGRRRHINAIRSGALPGLRVGRRYLARQADVEAFVRRARRGPLPGCALAGAPHDPVAQLAADLGLRRARGA